ncbi:MAG: hypothetical protein KatS3mg011_1368 [Acidimicrobiia bacterium]|nr:MAG: hypothetical protein KatS3mg011_1368 [Acidimicrobiia bacterium]
MNSFRGRLQSHAEGEADYVTVGIDDTHVRIWAENRRIGSWRVEDVKCERVTVFRFMLELDGVPHTFVPDDPAGFASSLNTVVDLRPKSRFGLAERVRAAKAERQAERT